MPTESPPPFNEAHPPPMTSADVLPPEHTAFATKGKPAVCTDRYDDRILDPKYPWQNMPHSTPENWEKRKQLRQ